MTSAFEETVTRVTRALPGTFAVCAERLGGNPATTFEVRAEDQVGRVQLGELSRAVYEAFAF